MPPNPSPYCLDGAVTLGLELTFIPSFPRSRWQEWRSKAVATEVTQAFNRALAKDCRIKELERAWRFPSPAFLGKADTFRSQLLSSEPQPHDAWCLEVNNHPFLLQGVTDRHSSITDAFKAVYETAASLDLHPYIERRRRDGTLIQFPTGGGHQHLSLNFWQEGAQYLAKLYHLEQALCVSYANHPEIRWLFSQWFDDVNSQVAINLKDARAIEGFRRRKIVNEQILTNLAHDKALQCHSIKQRIAYTGKPQQPTYEFRFFDMPRSVDELVLHAQFLEAWVGYWAGRTARLEPPSHDKETARERAEVRADWDRDTRYTMTPHRYRRLSGDLPYARTQIEALFKQICLDPEPYMRVFFPRNYLPRSEHGKAL